MKITQLAAKPQLVKLTIDDPTLVEEFGEQIEFWSYDRQPLDVFMKLASLNDSTNKVEMINIMRTLILDEEGKQVIIGETMLPTAVLLGAIQKLTELLGK